MEANLFFKLLQYNDVAVLSIDHPVSFTKTIRPICLPSGARAYAGKIATVIGWGSLRESKFIYSK